MVRDSRPQMPLLFTASEYKTAAPMGAILCLASRRHGRRVDVSPAALPRLPCTRTPIPNIKKHTIP